MGLKVQFMLYLLLLQGQKVLINHKAIICSDLIRCKLQETCFFFLYPVRMKFSALNIFLDVRRT